MARKAAWIVSILLLLNTGGLGIYNGVTEMSEARTALQKSVTGGVFVYGVLGVVATIALLVRHRSAVALAAAWAVAITYVASTAALAYGGNDATVGGAAAGGLGAALIGAFVIWSARAVTNNLKPTER